MIYVLLSIFILVDSVRIALSNIAQSDPLINSTAGSFSLVGSRPRRSAMVVQKLEDAGAVILGRTNMDVSTEAFLS